MPDYNIRKIGGEPICSISGIRFQEKGYKACIIGKSIFFPKNYVVDF